MRVHGGARWARLDFSANINPLAPPEEARNALTRCVGGGVLDSYPDYEYRGLREAIAGFYGVEPSHVIPTAGASEAINLAVVAVRPRRIVVLEPSYGEYEDLAGVLGAEYVPVYYRRVGDSFEADLTLLEPFCGDPRTLIVVTNPSNPLGIYVDRRVLADFVDGCRAWVLLDEAYAELCDTCPIDVGGVPSNAVVVRSFTKWLGFPGLRAGFLYSGSRELVRRIDVLRPPWNVNALAECVIVDMLGGGGLRKFIEASREYIRVERGRLANALRGLGLRVFNSVTNFLLVEAGRGAELVEGLARLGIAVRGCASFKGLGPSYIRVAVRRREENDELLRALRSLLGHEGG